jgi:hypothetical protein
VIGLCPITEQSGGYVRASTGPLPHQVVALAGRRQLGKAVAWNVRLAVVRPRRRQPSASGRLSANQPRRVPRTCHTPGHPAVSSGHSRAFPAADQDHRPPRSARRPGDRTSKLVMRVRFPSPALTGERDLPNVLSPGLCARWLRGRARLLGAGVSSRRRRACPRPKQTSPLPVRASVPASGGESPIRYVGDV